MSALAPTASYPACIKVRRDPYHPRLLVTIKGPASGQMVAESLSDAYLAEPDVTYLDMLFDLVDYRGHVEVRHVNQIVEAYLSSNRDPSHPCRTAFVSPDPFFNHWAAAMSYQFTGREHRAFTTFEAAERFLGQPIGQRTPFRPAAAA